MGKWEFTKGLHDLGNGIYAWLQPDGSWGLNNAGIIVSQGEALLVDTLYDLELTQEMLDAMQAADPAAGNIKYLVNTHSNGDHTYGNQLVKGAEIISSEACAEEFDEIPPKMMADILAAASQLGEMGAYFKKYFSRFNYEGIELTPPTRTFSGNMTIKVGSKDVELIEVGPCHTKGDVIVYVPEDRIVFAGDLLFIEGTPIMWAGPVSNWIKACDRILALDVEAIIPGHGPIVDKSGVEAMKGYFNYLYDEGKKHHESGITAAEAAEKMMSGPYSSWGDPERVAINVDTLYRELNNDDSPGAPVELFGLMAKLAS